MNLTLLPTDIKLTEKSQPTLNDPLTRNNSSEFGQHLNAEIASVRKTAIEADKNGLNNEKCSGDTPIEGELAPLLAVADNTVIRVDGKTLAGGKLLTETSTLESDIDFAVLKDEDLLSAEALVAAMPIQLAGLINAQSIPADGTENTDELLRGENTGAETLLGQHVKSGKNAKVDAALSTTDRTDHTKDGEQDKSIRSFATQETTLSNNAEQSTKTRPTLATAAGQVKLAINNKAEQHSASQNNGKELNQFQTAIQGIPALVAVAAETFQPESPAIPAASPLLPAGQQTTGQFQLNSTPTPLLSAHIGSEEWQQQLNQHVLFFNRNGLQQAELRLHPQELGALHIRMNVEDNQAQLHFVSAHQHVRTALEAALPGLRHALAENGIQLAQSSVGGDTQGNWQQEQTSNSPSHSHHSAKAQGQNSTAVTQMPTTHESAIKITPQQLASIRGGVDIFA
ncbi:flagellar hook-length control protein [Xenorhabdus bovienii str. Jollieti]|uniref:Flagellar hook-length control protein n=1 Tax=Xenorhabdus bovienii (strain SS-2004) TaxID=406818 RepID=D3V7M1_XENBS|nr:flagellar hook-length control protein FliK [Xenorhabdus bovienii]CBJ81833.1 flagellar hook-length control protein [Xenorhabdus bovienii SS-2004]CDH29509.1 flagellar hook-length control protein [Xenorhabdus bovienii str. Jollieti]